MGGKEFVRAKRLFQRKKYSDVIRILEPQVFRFRENTDFYFLLGASCFYSGDIAGAGTYLKRVLDLKKEDITAMLYMAVIYIRQHKNQDAIETWLLVLDSDPKNRYALRGLELLKKGSNDQQIITDSIGTNKVSNYLPKHISYVPVITLGIVVLFLIVPVVLILTENLSFFAKTPRNERIQDVFTENTEIGIETEGNFTYILTEKEIERLLDEANDGFNSYDDNAVQVIINRIKNSNASQSIKDKAYLLEKYLSKPDFTNFKGDFSYKDIVSEPLLYDRCYIRWKGRISNLDIQADMIYFDFLLGYQDNKVLEGIIPVRFDFAADLRNGDAVEIIARIETADNGLSVQGTSVRPISSGS